MDRVWILLLMSIGISLAHVCDGWRARAGGRQRRDAPAASVHAVFEQLRARSLNGTLYVAGPIRSHAFENSSRSGTGPAAHAPLQKVDTGEARKKAGRNPRQAARTTNTPERADRKRAHPVRLVG